ncbi:hypothetical protein OH799_11390 [Nocardia sp. NBC_00881]|uniref:HalD/BesD family halogenase n=1 Tax=Nocardia sp. NBC_00881 TaxID=2975995 RepID=UPI00386CDAC8|nr:hypothetical protein OH799_11390 [Nocardia sp. NBC_00881]
MVPESVRCAVAADAIGLVEQAGVRRDLVVAETGFTLQRMRNVTSAEISGGGSVIERIYQSPVLPAVLAEVVGEPVFRCPYEPEQFVITRLEESGDTHVWHWDDYSALVWVAECPAPVSRSANFAYRR